MEGATKGRRDRKGVTSYQGLHGGFLLEVDPVVVVGSNGSKNEWDLRWLSGHTCARTVQS